MQYCLDANVFIEAHRRYYAFDIAPGFWEALAEWAEQAIICSPLPVYDELVRSRDQLSEWAKNHRETLFVNPDQATVTAYSRIANLVNRRYEPHHVQDFLSGADPWVIACAKAHNLVVVTMEALKQEQRDQGSGRYKGRIKIPNVCQLVRVGYINTFDLLRALGRALR